MTLGLILLLSLTCIYSTFGNHFGVVITEDAVNELCAQILKMEQTKPKENQLEPKMFIAHIYRSPFDYLFEAPWSTFIIKSGCYQWRNIPCLGETIPKTFHQMCSFWQPENLPGIECFGKVAYRSQSSTQIGGKAAAQLCATAAQAVGKKYFEIKYIPLRLNVPSDHACTIWTYKVNKKDSRLGQWEQGTIPDSECRNSGNTDLQLDPKNMTEKALCFKDYIRSRINCVFPPVSVLKALELEVKNLDLNNTVNGE